MRVLVIGRAGGVWAEVEAAKALASFDQVVVVNGAGCDYPEPIDHWVSFHSLLFNQWITVRRHRGFPDCTSYWTSTYRGSSRGHLTCPPMRRILCEGGSSGLIATLVAQKIGGTRVLLAGVPMSPERGHYNEAGHWDEAVKHRKAWQDAKDKLLNVRSMSGWTQELLGAPDEDWLNG